MYPALVVDHRSIQGGGGLAGMSLVGAAAAAVDMVQPERYVLAQVIVWLAGSRKH
jgi:hypothetical protein